MDVLIIFIISTVVILIVAKFKGFNPWAWLLTGGILGLIIILFLPSGKDSTVDPVTRIKRAESGTKVGLWTSFCIVIATVIYIAYINQAIKNYSPNQDYNEYETEKTDESKTQIHDEIDISTVLIGSRIWFADNLNTTTFNNGDQIFEAKTNEEWINAGENQTPAWCNYDNNEVYGNGFGKLYNWYAVSDPRGLVPKGWHIPSDEEWSALALYLGGEGMAGLKMKYPSENDKNVEGINTSGFSGFLSGSRFGNGLFDGVGYYGAWWSSSQKNSNTVWIRQIEEDGNYLRRDIKSKNMGFAVRCIKGETGIIQTTISDNTIQEQAYQSGWQRIYIKDLGSIDIPPTMEIKDNNYKSFFDEVKKARVYDEIKIVVQQKGLNQNSKEGYERYARAIITNLKSPLGEMESLNFDFSDITESEMAEINKMYKLQSEQELKMIDMEIVEWYPAKFEKINGMSSMHISYKRQMKDQPFVIVHMYIFHNKDLIYQLTLSYRQSEENYWKTDFEKILKSFTITNIR